MAYRGGGAEMADRRQVGRLGRRRALPSVTKLRASMRVSCACKVGLIGSKTCNLAIRAGIEYADIQAGSLLQISLEWYPPTPLKAKDIKQKREYCSQFPLQVAFHPTSNKVLPKNDRIIDITLEDDFSSPIANLQAIR